MKRAIILAGGKGTRLRPYTMTLPKPLVPLGDMPIMEHIILNLKENDFTHITVTLNHMAEIIKSYFGDGSKWGVKIDYTLEQKALSTMGPLTLVKDLPDNFLVMNGDVLTDLNFSSLWEDHVRNNSLFTISSHRRVEKIDYGLLYQDDNNFLKRFEEKPDYSFLVSMGVYVVNKKILNYIPENSFFGFDDLMHKLLNKNEPVRIYEYNGDWLDIGRPSDYEKALNKISND